MDFWDQPNRNSLSSAKPIVGVQKHFCLKGAGAVSAPVEAERRCAVCKNICISTYYGVLCCSSCKQFFRRTIINKRHWKCINNGQCTVDEPQSKICCKACRFDKCLAVGMNWEAIQVLNKSDLANIFFAELVERQKQLRIMANDKTMQTLEMPIVNSDLTDNKLIKTWLNIEKRQKQIFEFFFNMPDNYLQFATNEGMQNYLETGSNILGQVHLFPISNLSEESYWVCSNEHPLILKLIAVDRLLIMGLAKMMPIFNTLTLSDRIALIKHMILPVNALSYCVYSLQINSTTWKRCRHLVEAMACHCKVPEFKNDGRLYQLAEQAFVHSMQPFLRIKEAISAEEFVMMQAILLSHSAISELSAQAQQLLYDESVRYTKILLKFEQHRLGAAAGAARFAQCLQLIDHSIYVARHLEVYCTYKEMFYYRKSIDQSMKEALISVSMTRHC
uniref:Nuclear receptor domain-containing protein n=1 Tax=Globodera rostochiensis TaxID=31243 RepID=A0A914IBS7_GLORO